ncbi:MAG: potassium efflux system KefA protein / Small-conductance mechanosensitive channel [Nevskia sp.]|nr:potassium efflux system KefA protein / Small-conductance mechanosensitive channel [Nevskia sp.]
MKQDSIWSDWLALLQRPLFQFGGSPMTLATLVAALIALLALLLFTRWLRSWLVTRVLARGGHIELSTRETIASLIRYIVLVIGVLSIVQGVGINLSSFTVLAGALGVGVGFGLQNIFSNFISGIIVMLERPVKVGDHIVVAGAEGDVIEIGARATSLMTAQGSRVIVPNQMFITGNVVNWDLQSSISAVVSTLRLKGEVPTNEKILLDVLAAEPLVLKLPMPAIYLIGVDYQGHILELHYAVAGTAAQRLRVSSAVNKAILAALQQHGIALAPNP